MVLGDEVSLDYLFDGTDYKLILYWFIKKFFIQLYLLFYFHDTSISPKVVCVQKSRRGKWRFKRSKQWWQI